MCSETWNLATGTKRRVCLNFRFTFGRKSQISPATLRQEPRNEKRELHFLLDILPQHYNKILIDKNDKAFLSIS